MKKPVSQSALRQTLIAASVAACFSLSSQQAAANPTGGTVAAGSASFAASGNTLTIANSANTVINWQGFSIGINEITRFLQSSPDSAVLNRVVGANGVIPQSVIDGMLQSNGRVFLINPMGVVFGASARIDVAGLVASSLNLSNEDFLAGRMRFTEVPGAGGVTNNGMIQTAAGGRVFLVAPSVENNGIIKAPQGEILLAAGKSAELVNEGTPLVTVRITADSEQALNVGQLVADSGRIGMYGALVRNAGMAEANGAVAGPGGTIRFVAAKDATLDAGSVTRANGTTGGDIVVQAQGGTSLISGTVEATGSKGKGGSVQALGVRVGVVGHGVIDASGETGGGTVLVGGDYQGKNAAIQNAQRTWIGQDGVIRADARTRGNGGKVIAWSDGKTDFYGAISARGGRISGDGGFVETSGKGALDVFGAVDTRAANGKAGSWLLDPTNIIVVAGTNGSQTDDSFVSSNGDDGLGASGDSTISAGSIAAYGGTVSLLASNDITFNANVTKSTGGLSVGAGHDIDLKSSVINVAGPIDMQASGSIKSTIAASATQLKTNGFSVLLRASAGDVTVGGIDTRAASTASDNTTVDIGAYGNVKTGDIRTGVTGDGDSWVQVSAGQKVQTGAITTGNALDGCGEGCSAYSYVDINAGTSVVTGGIRTGRAGNGGFSDITLRANNGGVTVNGDVRTGDGGEGNVDILADGGSVLINGGIFTGSVTGGSNWVEVESTGGSVTVNGNIATASGSGFDSSVTIYTGLSGGSITTGSITTGNVTAYGGSTYVDIEADQGVQVNGNIQTGNASNGNSGVSIAAATGALVIGGSTTTGQASNKTVDYYGAAGVSTAGGIFTRSFAAGQAGGDVGIITQTGAISIGGDIDTRGANGAYGLEDGSRGGSVFMLRQQGDVVPSSGPAISVNGGITTSGGDGAPASFKTGGKGGDAGHVFMGALFCEACETPQTAGSILVSGPIIAKGANGGASTNAAYGGGAGGYGGEVALFAMDSVSVGPTPEAGVTKTAIDTSGGAGGASPGQGGMGGSAGSVGIDPAAITINGVVLALGGDGGAGAVQGAGGAGGFLDLFAPGGTVTFVNGGYDLTGGAGNGPGASGTATIDGTLIFAFVTNSDVFGNPAVAQSIGSTINDVLKSTSSPTDKESDEDKKKKKGGISSCKP